MPAHAPTPWALFAAVALGCGSKEPAPPVAPSSPTQTQVNAAVPIPASTLESSAPTAAGSADVGPVDASPVDVVSVDPFAGTHFPPKDFAPPHERSAKEGDGQWERLGDADASERAAGDPPILYRTTVHPHEVSTWITVTVAAMDLLHTSLHLVAGTDDPGVEERADQPHAGLVPMQHHADLVAVFNGGFKPQHGGWGMMIAGKRLVPPREEGCTVMINPDDTVEIRSWPAVVSKEDKARAYRQTPPCLLESGTLHPALIAGNSRVWAGQNPKRKTRRRSAIGIDASGRTLFFGIGVEADPLLLAQGMKHAGAKHAAQLDINWNWTRFLVFGKKDGQLQITSTLIPGLIHRKRGYVEHTQPRDFFYLKRK